MSNDIRVTPKLTDRFQYGGSDQLQKVQIGSLDDVGKGIEAQYNPREISVDKSVAWSKHKNSSGDQPWLEFTGADGRSMGLELTFDGFEKPFAEIPREDATFSVRDRIIRPGPRT